MMPHAIEQTAQDIKPSMEKTETEKSFSSDGTYDAAKPPNMWKSWGFDMIICAGGLVSFLSEPQPPPPLSPPNSCFLNLKNTHD